MPGQLTGFRGLDKGEQALGVLSDFWQLWFKDKKILRDYAQSFEFDISQGYFDLMEGVLGTSLEHIPIFHKEKWYNLVLLEELTEEFAPGRYRHPKPTSMVNPGVGLFNRIYQPSVAFSENTDYYVDETYLYFNFDPMSTGGVATRFDVEDDGRFKRVSLWSLNSLWDENLLYDNFGYLLDLDGKSSDVYKSLLQGVWRLYVNGPSITNLEAAANVLLGIPICRTDEEEVRDISIDTRSSERVITTTDNIYRIPLGAELAENVVPGETLRLFQPVTTIVQIDDFITNPTWTQEKGLESAVINTVAPPSETVYLPVASTDDGGGGLEVNTVDLVIGNFTIGQAGAGIGGTLTVSTSDGDVLTNSQGVAITQINTLESLSEVVDIDILNFNTFSLKINGNIGGKYLATENQLEEVLKSALPAYTSFVYVTTSDLQDSYSLANVEETISQTIQVNTKIQDSYDQMDDVVLTAAEVQKYLLKDYYLPDFIIGQAPLIGGGGIISNRGVGMEDSVSGARAYDNYENPRDEINTDDAEPSAKISGIAPQQIYGEGAEANISRIGQFTIGGPFESDTMRVGQITQKFMHMADEVRIVLRYKKIGDEYLGRPWAVGEITIGSSEVYVGSTPITESFSGRVHSKIDESSYDGIEDVFNGDGVGSVGSSAHDEVANAEELGLTALASAEVQDTYGMVSVVVGEVTVGDFKVGGVDIVNVGEGTIGNFRIGPIFSGVTEVIFNRVIALDKPQDTYSLDQVVDTIKQTIKVTALDQDVYSGAEDLIPEAAELQGFIPDETRSVSDSYGMAGPVVGEVEIGDFKVGGVDILEIGSGTIGDFTIGPIFSGVTEVITTRIVPS